MMTHIPLLSNRTHRRNIERGRFRAGTAVGTYKKYILSRGLTVLVTHRFSLPLEAAGVKGVRSKLQTTSERVSGMYVTHNQLIRLFNAGDLRYSEPSRDDTSIG